MLRRAGFAVDLTAVAGAPNYPAVVAALERQIDITAGCGARAQIMALIRGQRMAAVSSTGGGGRFSAARGVEIDTVPLPPPDNPILLHELLHALHHGYLPGGVANPDILRFFQIARQSDLYPQATYMMSNHLEYFAVSGSLYLWGVVGRASFRRESLRRQPLYHAWLGELFGVSV